MNANEPWPPFRVLCVDDNHDIADSTVMLLRVVGFEAKAAYDGRTALRFAEEFLPNVCFIDLHMPGMDGDELARHLRRQSGRPVLLIAMTAMSDEASDARIAAAGFAMHMVKPVNPGKLVGVVDALFRQASLASSAIRENQRATQ